ncbi:MAG TPA: hypothetical protein VF246_00925 [Acidimicrobiia bacterium]
MTYRSTQVAHRRSQAVDRRVMSPARIVAGLLGVFLLVMGGVALARTGLSSLTGETATVFGFEHTTLMGLIDVVAGLLFLVAAAAISVRGQLTGVSLLAAAFGAVMMIEPDSLSEALGGGTDLGLVYVVVGLLGLLAAMIFPTRVTETEAIREDVDRY